MCRDTSGVSCFLSAFHSEWLRTPWGNCGGRSGKRKEGKKKNRILSEKPPNHPKHSPTGNVHLLPWLDVV